MFIRFSFSLGFLALGMASPWLLKDLLAIAEDPTPHYAAATQPSSSMRFLAAPRKAQNTSNYASQSALVRSDDDNSTGSRRAPYPVALQTERVVQAIAPKPIAAKPRSVVSLFRSPAPSSSSKTRALAQLADNRMKSSLNRLSLNKGSEIFLRIFKEEKELEMWIKGGKYNQFTLFRIYKIEDWSGTLGPKIREGDRQTPEGFYYVSASRFRPETRHHLGFDIGYPNAYDKYHKRSGSDILVHGKGSSAGSVVLSNPHIEEIYTLADAAIRNGQRFFRVNIFPFRMTDQRMNTVWKQQGKWTSFWVNLKEGYDFFENVGYPPDAGVMKGKYVFSLH